MNDEALAVGASAERDAAGKGQGSGGDPSPSGQRALQVPSVFDGLHMAATSSNGAASRADDGTGQLLREAIMTFVRTLMRGVVIEVLLDDGNVLLPECSLNFELTHLILDVQDAQRAIPLCDVECVAALDDLRRGHILTTIQPHLDERCCTLVVKDCEFVTFRFDTVRLREYFQTCLRVLIARGDGRK